MHTTCRQRIAYVAGIHVDACLKYGTWKEHQKVRVAALIPAVPRSAPDWHHKQPSSLSSASTLYPVTVSCPCMCSRAAV